MYAASLGYVMNEKYELASDLVDTDEDQLWVYGGVEVLGSNLYQIGNTGLHGRIQPVEVIDYPSALEFAVGNR